MTITATRGLPNSSAPATQNTAPVAEFRCLYTHDLRRKAKRWQDGFLRYHTFNRRVMVYDVSRNFVGDTYNRSGADLEEGDELELEKDFALVQVSESTGVTQTDITELLQSRQKKDRPESSKAGKTTYAAIPSPAHRAPLPAANKHRSLGALLGTPKGPLGKASLPATSPFEDRQKRKAHLQDRPSKKQRHAERAGSLSSVDNVVKNRPESARSVGPGTTTMTGSKTVATPAGAKVVIDLCSDDPSISDYSSPASARSTTKISKLDFLACQRQDKVISVDRSEHRSKPPLPQVLDTPTTSSYETPDPEKNTLRVISNAPRKMLLCQQIPPSKQHGSTKVNSEVTGSHQDESPADLLQQRVQERLARIGKKRASNSLMASAPLKNTDRAVASERQPHRLVQQPEHSQGLETSLPGPQAVIAKTRPQIPAGTATIIRKQQPVLPADGPTTAGGQHKDRSHLQAAVPVSAKNISKVAVTSRAASLGRPGRTGACEPTSAPTTDSMPQQAAMPRLPIAELAERPPDPLDSGPWSREALDLFDWWPPNRDRTGHKLAAAT